MLSSCWFTTPFTGCFSTSIKGGVGSGMQEGGDGEQRVRVSQPPSQPTKHQVNINGVAGGASTGASAEGAGTAGDTQPAEEQLPRTPRLEADRIIGGETMFGEDDKLSKRAYKSEYRKKFRPFSQYQYVDGKFLKVKGEEATAGATESPNNWYKEVIELRKQAGQYRHRGWGVETASERLAEIYSKQAELWEQVSRRSSLQALSLASASPSRPISKAEKEIENSRRSSPIKHVSKPRERPSTAPPKPKPAAVHAQKATDKTDGKTSKESTPRHHYERTTGTTEDGLLITSPSRDKLEPFIPDDWSTRRSSRRTPPITSPVKDGPSRRKSYRASSAARPPPTKDCRSSVGGRSVSVGPENRSPKRTSRPPSTHTTTPAAKPERRPRPSEEIDTKKDKEKDIIPKDGPKDAAIKDTSKEPVEAVKEAAGRRSTPEPRFDPEKYEPVVKTPPEPTRVKSPDQMMVKSPDPVNWTVPLDTGKTFTVTHNIPEGESARGTPSSEHRHVLESRTRQTPEPTKISQGSLVGTPVSTTISSEPKPHSQEQPKPTTATTVESKFDDKPVDKKSSITAEVKFQESKPETKIPESKSLDVDAKSTESKAQETKTEKTLSEVKDTTKLTESKPLDTKPAESKLPEVKPLESKEPEVKPFEPKASVTKPSDSVLSESKPALSSDYKTADVIPTEPKKIESVLDSKPFSSLPSQQQQQKAPSSTPAPTQASPMDSIPPSGAVDSMTMSMFGSLNGMNGKSSGTPSPTKPEVPLPSEPAKDGKAESKPVGVRNVPGTNLRCLDDPSFMFDQPSAPTTNSPKSGAYKVLEAPLEPAQPKSGGYRVLEAPGAPSDIKDLPDQSPTKPEAPIKPSPYRVLEAPIDPPTKPKGSPYRVLEAPDAPYYPQTQSVGAAQESKPPSLVSPSSGRTVTDALDKARTRFDSFWGGPKDKDPPSKV
uniref:Nuclear protein MDM1 n=2 Tax=Scylla olivacea TaxID=85551 RepID=A0A0N7ZA17_SCYOL